MTVADLQYGQRFYFPEYPGQYFIYMGMEEVKKKTGKCVPSGKIYPKYISLAKEVITVKF